MKVIEHLKKCNGDFSKLTEDYFIKTNFHPSLPLVILNYDQINSPKMSPIVQECRGLVLNSETLEPVARGFKRFFNWGEVRHYAEHFDWSTVKADVKEDGSFILLYYFDGEWRISTRGSFGDGEVNFSDKTWSELFFSTIKVESLNSLDKDVSYVFELVGPYNKVVRRYLKTASILLTCVDTKSGVEKSDDYKIAVASLLGTMKVDTYPLTTIGEIQAFLKRMEIEDPTFEGFVIRDASCRRWKVKSSTYVALHHMHGNGNIHNPKYLLPFILNGESDEVLTYFPECKPSHDKLKKFVDDSYVELEDLWSKYRDEPNQKEFALAIVPQTKFSAVLFMVRKSGRPLEEVWKESADLILKVYK